MQKTVEEKFERMERFMFNRKDFADAIGKALGREVKWDDLELNCHSDDELLLVTLVTVERHPSTSEGSYEEGFLDAKDGSQRTNPSPAYLRGWVEGNRIYHGARTNP